MFFSDLVGIHVLRHYYIKDIKKTK